MANRIRITNNIKVTGNDGKPYRIQFVRPGYAHVNLVSWTQDPAKVMAITTRGYTGVYDEEIDWAESQQMFHDIVNTKLQTPFEMVHTLWLLRDVSRAFTHQLVRYRVGTSFVQESMRFFGAHGTYRVLCTVDEKDKTALAHYYEGSVDAVRKYHDMVLNGVPSQDARGVLPTNILTRLWFSCSLRTLQNIFPQRLCCQAQPGEWQLLLKDMRTEIQHKMGKSISNLLRAPYELGQPCGYRASFDRPCIWQNNKEGNDV